MRRRHRHFLHKYIPPVADAQTRYWTLRLALYHPDCRKMLSFDLDDLPPGLREIFLRDLQGDGDRQFNDIQASFEQALRTARKEKKKKPSILLRNIQWFGESAGLTKVERQILAFGIAHSQNQDLARVTELAAPTNQRDIEKLLSVALDVPISDVHEALHPSGNLARTNLLTIQLHSDFDDNIRFEVMEHLQDVLLQAFDQPQELLESFHSLIPEPECTLEDFEHLHDKVERMLSLLRGALKERSTGINILIYGPPGTGKTELSRVVTKALGATGYQVREEYEGGRRWRQPGRFDSYLISQRLLSRANRALFVFDEADELFGPRAGGLFEQLFGAAMARRGSDSRDKFNTALEQNPVPTIWIGNDFNGVDPAVLRRFSMVVEIPVPSRKVRERILRKATASTDVSEKWIEKAAGNPELGPGIVTTAARAAHLMKLGEGPGSTEENMDWLIRESARLRVGCPRAETIKHPSDLGDFDTALVNASLPLERLTRTLERTAKGSVLLYGPPGTGKTAYAHFVAKSLGVVLLVRSVSDIFNPYVGVTEKKIASAFREAREHEAILFFDEADSLLRSRQFASRGWEITRVNELLQQIERFEGVVFCATNLVDTIDPAAMRRFSFKVRLDPSTTKQRVVLLRRALEQLDSGSRDWNEDELLASAKRLAGATPGDFAAVVRQMQALEEPADLEHIEHLVIEELSFRPENRKRTVGFGRE